MRLTVVATSRFRRDFRRAVKRGLDTKIFEEIVDIDCSGRNSSSEKQRPRIIGKFQGVSRVSYTE